MIEIAAEARGVAGRTDARNPLLEGQGDGTPVLDKVSTFVTDLRGVRANMSSLLAPMVTEDTREEASTVLPLLSSLRYSQ